MKSLRTVIATILGQWLHSPDPEHGPCVQVRLLHLPSTEIVTMRKLNAWTVTDKTNVAQLAEAIEEWAKSDAAESSGGGIFEQYGLVPFYGKATVEGGLRRFKVACVNSETSNSPIGAYTEGPTDRGQVHQGMRHTEAMAATFVGGIQSLIEEQRMFIQEVSADRRALVAENIQMRRDLNEAQDRRAERDVAVMRAYEEEKRWTIFFNAMSALGPQILNLAMGRPILPENSDDATVLQFKGWLRGLTIEEMEGLRKTLPEHKYAPVMYAKIAVTEEDEKKEAEKEAEAKKAVSGVQTDPAAMQALARRDDQPIAPINGK